MASNGGYAECPNCHRSFGSVAAVVRHLNHPHLSCTLWSPLPDSPKPTPPSSPVQNDPEAHPPTTFPLSGRIFGKGRDFMDGFCTDRFAEDRNTNIYYPFASKDEWELGAFLTKSNLSIKLTDQLLSLGLVSLRLWCSSLPVSSPHEH